MGRSGPALSPTSGTHCQRYPAACRRRVRSPWRVSSLLLLLLALPAAAFLAVAVFNRSLYTFFRRQGGNRFAALCIALHSLYYLYSGLTYLYAWLEYRTRGAALAIQRLSRAVAR